MKTLISFFAAAILSASCSTMKRDLLNLKPGDLMPKVEGHYEQEFFQSLGLTFGFVRRYKEGALEIELYHTLCGDRDEVPYLMSVKYPDLPRARIYTDVLPKDQVIDSATIVPYPFESISPKDYPFPCPKGQRHSA